MVYAQKASVNVGMTGPVWTARTRNVLITATIMDFVFKAVVNANPGFPGNSVNLNNVLMNVHSTVNAQKKVNASVHWVGKAKTVQKDFVLITARTTEFARLKESANARITGAAPIAPKKTALKDAPQEESALKDNASVRLALQGITANLNPVCQTAVEMVLVILMGNANATRAGQEKIVLRDLF